MPKGKDTLSPNSIEWLRRQERHRHNGFTGYVAMARANMDSIMCATTATHDAKKLASKIHSDLIQLGVELRTRIDRKS
jgi:hypothetical protein